MKIQSNGRKILAIVCALAMLASLMVSFGISASAAATELGSWGAETTNGSGVDWAQSSNHTTQSDRPMSIVDKGTAAKEGSKVIVAKYTTNANDACFTSDYSDGTMQLPAGGRVGMFGSDSNKISSNSWYRITFYYRVAYMPTGTDAEIKFIVASRNWNSNNYNSKIKGAFTAATIPAGTAAGDWIAAAGYVKVSSGEGFHITLAPTDNRYRNGMEIWLDDIHIYKVNTAADRINLTVDVNDGVTDPTTQWGYAGDPLSSLPVLTRDNYTFDGWYDAAEGGNKVTAWPSSATTVYPHWTAVTVYHKVNFHGCGATWQATTEVEDVPGTEVSTPNPAREGYTFLGWYDAATGGNQVDTFTIPETEDLDVYAQWELTGTYVPNADTQTFEETATLDEFTKNNKNFVLDSSENRTPAGGKSLRIDVTRNYQGQMTRPRLVLKNGNSTSAADFVAENGESYRITLWAKSTSRMPKSFVLYVAAMNPDDVDEKIAIDVQSSGSVPGGGGYASVHTMQSMAVPGATMSSDNSISNAKASVTLNANVWTKVVINIDDFAGWDGADSLVALGIGDSNAGNDDYISNVIHHSIYIDDISIVKTSDLTAAADALDYQSFENADAGTDVDVKHQANFSAVISDDGISHNTGMADANSKAVKITQKTNDSGVGRVQMYVTDKDGNKIQMQDGTRYVVSFWAYVAEPAIVADAYVMPAVRFWVAPGDGENAIAATNGSQKDALKVYEANNTSDTLEPTVWRQYTFVTSASNANGDSSGYMVLGIAAARFIGSYTQVFYVDDIAVTELGATGGVQTFDGMTAGENVNQRTDLGDTLTAAVSNAQAHSGTQSVKVRQTIQGDGNRVAQIFIGDSSNYNVGLMKELGKEYLVSFWVRADKDATITFWVTPTPGSISSSATKDTYCIAEKGKIDLTAGEWTCITVKTNATPAVAANDRAEKLMLGIRATQVAGAIPTEANPAAFYIDDIAVTKVESAYTLPSGNVALYTNQAAGGVHTYTKGGEPRSAFRVCGGYTVNGDDYASAVLNAANYTVVERGIILANATIDEANLTLTSGDADILKIQSKTEDLDQCWGDENGVIKYSLLVKNVSAANADRAFLYRTYIKVRDYFGTEILLYSNVSGEVSLNTVATACGTSISWS